MYKLLAIDLDGTLLNSYGQISEENKNAIKKALEQNVEVVLASGRSNMSVKNLADEVNANNYIICGNGAIVYDLKKEEIIYSNLLNKNKVMQLVKICDENSIYYSVYTKDTIITKNLNYNVLFYHQENASKPDNKKTNIQIVQDIYNYILNSPEEEYIKIVICDDSSIIFNSIIKKMKTIKGVDVLDVGHMSRKIIKSGTEEFSIEYFYTEINNKNVDKWTALSYLIEKLGIKKEEVITIGDNVNDKIMIENAGLGVAMENSAPDIKQIADVVTSTNNENGVAKIIEEVML